MGRGEEFIERLRRETLVADGAMGTELMARGLAGPNLDAAPLRSPELVAEVHAAHVAAGAQLLRTATFSANRPRLSITGLKREWEAINREAVALARAAAGDGAVLAGSLGPCFAPADSQPTPAEREDEHRRQAEVLADAGVDLLLCETFTALGDAAGALRAALSTGLPVIAQLSLLKPATSDGVEPGPALLTLAEVGAAAVGVNCGTDSDWELAAVKVAARIGRELLLTAFPNAGAPAETAEGLVYPFDAAAIAGRAVRLQNAGARLIGGCCGTPPAAIAAIRAATARSR